MVTVYMHGLPKNSPPPKHVLRQTFFGKGIVDDYKFTFNLEDEANYIVIHGAGPIDSDVLTRFEKKNRICINVENPTIWQPTTAYLESMGIVVTSFPMNLSSNVKQYISHPCASWFYGLDFRTDVGLTHDINGRSVIELQELSSQSMSQKTKLLSFVCSTKGWTEGHKWRLQIAQALQKHFGASIDIFGFGWNPIADKKQAIDNYKYSIAIENMESQHWWTEKLADPILGYSIPIYSGANDISRHFEAEIPQIKYGISPDEYIKQVEIIISRDYDLGSLYRNRHKLLYTHNIYYFIKNLINYMRSI